MKLQLRNLRKRISKEQLYSWLIGLALFTVVIHNPNQPLIETKIFFLPTLSLVVILFLTADYLIYLKRSKVKLHLGSKWLWIPLLIIALSIILRPAYSLITQDFIIIDGKQQGFHFEIINSVIASGFFFLFVLSRQLKEEIFKPLIFFVILTSISTFYGYFVMNGKNGGIISPTNYDMVTGFLVFGFLVSSLKHRWWLSSITLVGLFFTGADEAVFVCTAILAIILWRKDWSKKSLLPVATLILLLAICTPLGITQKLYFPTLEKVAAGKEVIEETAVGEALDKIVPEFITAKIETAKPSITNGKYIEETKGAAYLNEATGYRFLSYWQLSKIKLLGHGFNMNNFYPGIPHNAVLIIIEQIGILGALAWLFVVFYGIIKTKWKYAWLGFLALGVFDHFIWTQAAPWFWVLAGVSSVSNTKGDLIFKGDSNAKKTNRIQNSIKRD